MQPGRAQTSGLGVPLLPLARWVSLVAPVCPTHWVLVLSCPSSALCVRGVPGLLAPVHRCARAVCFIVSAVSRATWPLFTGVPARCVASRGRCPGPLGSRSPVCPLSALCCVCGVLGHLAPLGRCACSVCCFACAVSWVTWLLFTDVPALSFVLIVRCPGPLGSCSPVCPRGLLCCVCGVLGHLAPIHRCVRSLCCVACAVSWTTWLLFTGALARCVAMRARCPGPLGSCSPVCQAVVFRPFVALGARACAVSWPSWRPFGSVRAVCGARLPCLCPSSSPPDFLFFLFFLMEKNTGARVHCRHRHGQLVRRCNSVVSSGVSRRCCGGGRAPRVQLARPDVHGYGPGWVWLGVSLLLELAG